jgi:hypothetical protein
LLVPAGRRYFLWVLHGDQRLEPVPEHWSVRLYFGRLICWWSCWSTRQLFQCNPCYSERFCYRLVYVILVELAPDCSLETLREANGPTEFFFRNKSDLD